MPQEMKVPRNVISVMPDFTPRLSEQWTACDAFRGGTASEIAIEIAQVVPLDASKMKTRERLARSALWAAFLLQAHPNASVQIASPEQSIWSKETIQS